MPLFPSNPSNGATANVNGYQFTFDSTSNTWNRTQSFTGNLAVDTLNASGNANVGNLGTAGNITANYFFGNGAFLTGIASGTANTAQTVTNNAQPNITSVGTLTSLSVSGNANVDNIGATNGVFTNVSGNGALLTNLNASNLTTGIVLSGRISGNYTGITGVGSLVVGSIGSTFGNINIGSNIFTGNGSGLTSINGSNVTGQVANALVAGTVYTNAQPNITSVGTLGSLSVTGTATIDGNVRGGNLITSGNANVGNLGTSGLITSTGNVTVNGNIRGGNLVTSGNANVGNLGFSSGVITGSGNITAGFFIGNGSQLTGVAAVTATTAQTVTNNAQPNITSVGALTSLSVSGNANVGNLGTSGLITATGNITGGNLLTPNNIIVGNTASLITIGTTTPVVQVKGAATASGSSLLLNRTSADSFPPGIWFAKDRSNGLVSAGDELGIMRFLGHDSSSYFTSATISGLVDSTASANNVPGRLVFSTAGNATALTERMRINSSGNVGIANSAPTHTLSIGGTLNVSSNANVGNIGATNGVFTNISGNGALLTDLNGSNITTGQVNNARLNTLANTTDTTQGRLIKSGDWGFATTAFASGNLTDTRYNYSQIFRILSSEATGPGVTGGGIALPVDGTPATSYLVAATDGRLFTGHKAGSSATPTWREILPASTTGNATIGNISVTGVISSTGAISTSARMNAVGLSTSWGVTTGNSVGAFNGVMGTGAAATWLLSGTSNGVFRAGIQVLDTPNPGELRIYESANLIRFSNNNLILSGILSTTGNANIGNLNLSGNIVDSGPLTIQTSTNGNITLSPNGTGTTIVNSALSATGNVTANFFIGNGSQLTGITGGVTGFTSNVGNASANTFTITHNLNKEDIFVTVREYSSGYLVYPDIKYSNANAIILEFVSAPTANQYRVSVFGF